LNREKVLIKDAAQRVSGYLTENAKTQKHLYEDQLCECRSRSCACRSSNWRDQPN